MQQNLHIEPSGPSPEAVEVACTLGDSVVHVSHLEHTDDAPTVRSSLMVMLAGAAFLLMSAGAFAKGIATAAADRAAFHEWTEIYRLPASEFQHQGLGIGWDYMAFGGLLFGLAAVGFGLFRLRTRRAKRELIVGRDGDVDVAADVDTMPMVRTSAAGSVVSVAPGMTAELWSGSTSIALPELAASGRARPSVAVTGGYDIDLTTDATVRVAVGPAGFVVRPSQRERSRVASFAAGLDGRAASFFAGSAAVHLALILLFAWVAPATKSLAVDSGSGRTRLTMIDSKPSEDPIDETQPDPTASGDEVEGSGIKTAAPGAHGLEGNHSTRDAGKTQIARRAPEKQMSRAQAIAEAQRSGVLGSVNAAYFRQLVGASDFTSGDADIDTWGRHGRDGDSSGEFGWSATPGGGPGAGGNHDTISTDDSDYYKQGPVNDGGKIGPHGRDPKGPQMDLPKVVDTWGGLDKETIRRYIKRQASQLRYAYEKALLIDGSLDGTVTVTFVINGQGLVIEARATGMGPVSMRQQIESVFESIKFPRPSGGGVVRVTYPINYHRAG